MNFEKKDYSYIGSAGRQIQQGIKDIGVAIDQAALEKAKQIDGQTFDNQIYPQQIEEAAKRAKEAGLDDVSAHALAVRYFPPRFQTEKVEDAVKRFAEVDPKFNNEILQAKEKLFHQKAEGTPAVPEQPGNIVQPSQAIGPKNPYTTPAEMVPVANPQAAEAARSQGRFQPTSMIRSGPLPGDEPAIPGQDIPTPAQPAKPMGADEMQQLAIQMGIGHLPSVQEKIKTAKNMAIGQQKIPENASQEQVYGQQLASGSITPEGETYAKMFPTKQQQEANRIKIENQKDLNDYRTKRIAAQERLAQIHAGKLAKDLEIEIMNGKSRAIAESNKLILKVSTDLDKLQKDYKEAVKGGGRPTKNFVSNQIEYIPDDAYVQSLLEAVQAKHEALVELEQEKELNEQIYEGIRNKKTNASQPVSNPKSIPGPAAPKKKFTVVSVQ